MGILAPTLTYTTICLITGESLKTGPTLVYDPVTPDMTRVGTVAIKANDAVVPDGSNYKDDITYVDGTLIISKKTSGGGNISASSDGPSSSSTKASAPSTDAPKTGQTTVTPQVDSNGNATVTVTDKAVTDAIKTAKYAAKKDNLQGKMITAEIVAQTDKSVTQVTATLPKTVQETLISNKVDAVKITTDTVTMSFSQTAIQQINEQAKADVTITAAKSDTSKLTGDAKALIGSRPMFDFNATYGSGKKITNSSYDADQQAVIFTTSNFSQYGIGYQASYNFTDISNHWAKTYIEFVANRGLMSCTSKTTFAPNGSMTRGMFVTALGRLAGVDMNSYNSGKFTDVKADAYYANYVNWAASKGITNDTTATIFSPDKTVTRQEMEVFMSNYAKIMGYKVPETHVAVTFADNISIGSWAAKVVKEIQMAGVLNGKNGNKFDPTGTATRAEVATVLHRYVELIIEYSTGA